MSRAGVFLIVVLALSAGAIVAQIARRRWRSRQVRQVAVQAGLHYSPVDRFALAGRIAPKLECPGAANVHILDLVYGLRNEQLRYVFTVEFTRGVLRTKRTPRRAFLAVEPKNRAVRDGNLQLTSVDGALDLIHQYQQLIAMGSA